jgi:hypothetical protein
MDSERSGGGTEIIIRRPDAPSIVTALAPAVEAARLWSVHDIESNRVALERVRDLRAGEKRIAEHFEPARKAMDEAKREILKARDSLIGPIAEARDIYDRKAAEFEQAERKKALERQRLLDAEARRQEEERALLDAVEAETAGDSTAADAILAEPIVVPQILVAPAVAHVEGVTSRTTWSAEVSDLHALVRYVAAHPEWISLLEANQPNLNRLAVSQRQALAIPGVRAVSKSVRSVR